MATKSDYARVFILRTIGNFFLLSSLAGVILTFSPAISAEFTYRYDQLRGQKYIVVGDPDPCLKDGAEFSDVGVVEKAGSVRCNKNKGVYSDPGLLGIPDALAISPIDREFGLVIPKIGANARVIANVDPSSSKVYIEALKRGVAHAEGTVYPGQVGNSFLFAHSVGNFWEVNRWNAVFYLLRELQAGDELDVFYKGQRYIYQVYGNLVVVPTDTKYIEPQADFPKLTLQTCWPPGTTLRRLLVFARLKE
jgi:sortase A